MRPLVLASILAVLALPALAQERTERRSPAQPMPAPELEARLLDAHNAARREVGVPDLAWSPALADQARVWAWTLARSGRFEHDTERGAVGENLWTGWGRRFSPEEMIQAWTGERQAYVHGAFPDVRRPGDTRMVGHYTQMVWRSTIQVGCALVEHDGRQFLACRYSPPGNVIGQTAY